MSFSLASLFASAESALASFETVAAPLQSVASSLVPVVETLAPSTAPTINAVTAGSASIAAVAPAAVQDVTSAIAAGKQAYADIGPAITGLEAIYDKLFHVTAAPGGVVILTPKTTAATVPAPAAS